MPDAGRRDGPARGLGRPREIARRKDHAASLPGWPPGRSPAPSHGPRGCGSRSVGTLASGADVPDQPADALLAWRSLASLRSRSLSCSVSSGVGSARSRVAPRVAGAPCGTSSAQVPREEAAAPCPGRGPFASTDPERPAVRRVRSGACRPAIGSGGSAPAQQDPTGFASLTGLRRARSRRRWSPTTSPSGRERQWQSEHASHDGRRDGSSRFERTVVKYHEGKVYANSAAPPGCRVPFSWISSGERCSRRRRAYPLA